MCQRCDYDDYCSYYKQLLDNLCRQFHFRINTDFVLGSGSYIQMCVAVCCMENAMSVIIMIIICAMLTQLYMKPKNMIYLISLPAT